MVVGLLLTSTLETVVLGGIGLVVVVGGVGAGAYLYQRIQIEGRIAKIDERKERLKSELGKLKAQEQPAMPPEERQRLEERFAQETAEFDRQVQEWKNKMTAARAELTKLGMGGEQNMEAEREASKKMDEADKQIGVLMEKKTGVQRQVQQLRAQVPTKQVGQEELKATQERLVKELAALEIWRNELANKQKEKPLVLVKEALKEMLGKLRAKKK